MGWLIGNVMGSMVAAFVIVRVWDWLSVGVTGSVASVARASIFVTVWTAITTVTGMRAVDQGERQLRQVHKGVLSRLKPLNPLPKRK